MQTVAVKLSLLLSCLSFTTSAFCQPTWKLLKNEEGISVYESSVAGSNFKNIKVECTLQGTYDKLVTILRNVEQHKDWVYNNKSASILKRVNDNEFYYYTETSLPWPMSNRDAVMHLTITRDVSNRYLKIHSVAKPDYIAEKSGKVRVPSSNINWHVTMPSASTIQIVYTFEANPGGSVPAWLVNNFAEKGPFESFKKLAVMLKK